MGKFKKWIDAQGGPRVVARLMGTESPTVINWVARRATPTALRMQRLVKLGKGAFSYDDLINETARKRLQQKGE